MTVQTPNRRTQIIELLRLLASEELQLAYERDVPHIDVTAELLCMWFDDQYHPNNALFSSCFTADELVALADFHQVYSARSDQLPESEGTVRTWLDNPTWCYIMQEAQRTLARISG